MVTEEHCSVSIKKHPKPGFIHLHNHSEFSILDGMCKIRDLVSRAEKLGMPAVAITDHGNMFDVIEFYKSCKEAGIKPIIGCEVYYVPDMKVKISRDSYHLTLLVKDLAGYKNLIQITTAGYRDGFYYRPRVDLDLISKHSDGLIALSGCIKGYVPAQIIKGEYPKAEVELGKLRDVFGRDLYVELMDHGLPEQTIANRGLLRLARRLQVPAVATNDCHYIHPSDALAHDTLLCIQTRSKLDDPDRFRFDSDQFYFRSPDEMAALFDREYLSRTMEIAEKCDLKLDLGTSHMPQFTPPGGLTPDEYLWHRIQQGVQERYGGNLDPDREKRLVDEYEIIRETGFSGYFLIVDDLVQHAKQQGIRVGGRGSAVASLVCFTIGITDVDPVEHGLLFQRFIAPGRISPPDIDLDFSHDQRDEVIGYLAEKYGHVAQILTFTRLAPRSIIRDVGRTLGIDQAEIDSAAKSIPKRYLSEEESRPLADLVDEVPELQGLDPRVIDIGTRLHGIVRHTGCHPGGLVVSDRSLTDLVPLCTSRGVELTQFDKDTLETCGLLKIDILGNRFLTVVDMTSPFVEQAYGTRIDDPPADDPETYNMICAGDVSGVFQLGQDYGKGIVEDMQPRSFADLVHTISLGRPGVLALDRYFEARAVGNVQFCILISNPYSLRHTVS